MIETVIGVVVGILFCIMSASIYLSFTKQLVKQTKSDEYSIKLYVIYKNSFWYYKIYYGNSLVSSVLCDTKKRGHLQRHRSF